MTHKSIDYKMSAVKYYFNNNDDIRKTCKIFEIILHRPERKMRQKRSYDLYIL